MPLDELHRTVAVIALRAAAGYGFALGGGNALIQHGVISRPTQDVDLFTDHEAGVQAAAGTGPWRPRCVRQASTLNRQRGAAGLKRQVSNAIYQHLQAGARRAAGPGGHPGNGSVASAAGLHPGHRLFGQATPGPAPTLRSRPGPSKAAQRTGKPRRVRQSAHPHVRLARVLRGTPSKHSGGEAASLPCPIPRRFRERPSVTPDARQTPSVQEFDKGRGPVGLPADRAGP
jgi:hypothetical protein